MAHIFSSDLQVEKMLEMLYLGLPIFYIFKRLKRMYNEGCHELSFS